MGGRAGCAVPPSRCQLPVRTVPGWRALGFQPELWIAPNLFTGVVAGAEEAGKDGTPPCCPGGYGLAWLLPYCGYHCDCLRDLGLGGGLTIGLNDFSNCGYANENTFRRVGS